MKLYTMEIEIKRQYVIRAENYKKAREKARKAWSEDNVTPHINEIHKLKTAEKLGKCYECGRQLELTDNIVYCHTCHKPMHKECSRKNPHMQPSCEKHMFEASGKTTIKQFL